MMRGRVVGEAWGARRSPGIEGTRLLLVGEPSTGRLVVALDTLDARVGQEVLVAFGSGARNVLAPGPENRRLLCDAAIALVVDGAATDLADPAAPADPADPERPPGEETSGQTK